MEFNDYMRDLAWCVGQIVEGVVERPQRLLFVAVAYLGMLAWGCILG